MACAHCSRNNPFLQGAIRAAHEVETSLQHSATTSGKIVAFSIYGLTIYHLIYGLTIYHLIADGSLVAVAVEEQRLDRVGAIDVEVGPESVDGVRVVGSQLDGIARDEVVSSRDIAGGEGTRHGDVADGG